VATHNMRVSRITVAPMLFAAGLANANTTPNIPRNIVPLLDTRSNLIPESILSECYLTAIVEGENILFSSAEEKFAALAESWQDYNLGRSVLDYHDFAMLQIIGMGSEAVQFLLKRVAEGESEWIYALKSIAGLEAETPEMIGDEQAVVEAWLGWGEENGKYQRQTPSDEEANSEIFYESES
jgi:hypothetical protein